MQNHLAFRKDTVSKLTNDIGCYVLTDLDNVPIYVGQSTDGIRSRVGRHLTSARSDIVANRQIDVWEIAYVWAYPVTDKSKINQLEANLFYHFDNQSQLMNGQTPRVSPTSSSIPDPSETIQVITNEDLNERLSPEARLPRQAQHYAQLVDHYLVVKQSTQIARSMQAHFERLKKYHSDLLNFKEHII